MAWLISVLGAVLALAGAISLGNGITYIRLDWGQTETVAGTVALSAGIVTLALGAVLFALRDLARQAAASRPAGVGMDALTWSEDEAPVQPALSRFASKLATVGMPKTEQAAAVPVAPSASRQEAVVEPPPLSGMSLRATLPEEPEILPAVDVRERPVVEAPRPVASVMAEAPTVVGRYEANGASYVLFSDGTIEVETEDGTHRFASMSDLKDHIERQEAG